MHICHSVCRCMELLCADPLSTCYCNHAQIRAEYLRSAQCDPKEVSGFNSDSSSCDKLLELLLRSCSGSFTFSFLTSLVAVYKVLFCLIVFKMSTIYIFSLLSSALGMTMAFRTEQCVAEAIIRSRECKYHKACTVL